MWTSSARNTLPASRRVVRDRQLDRVVHPAAEPHVDRVHRLAGDGQGSALKRPAVGVVIQAARQYRPVSASTGTSGGVKPDSSMSQSSDAAPAATSALCTASSASSRRSGRPGQSSTARSARRGGPPVDAELPGDGVQLRRFDHDAAARLRAGTQHAVGVRAGIVEQIATAAPSAACSVVILRNVAASASRAAGSSAERRQSMKGTHGDHRRLVSVDSMSSLVVITLLFIS